MPEFAAPDAHAAFQYESPAHEEETALSGMWLFLATELLLFGGLFLLWMIYSHTHPSGFRLATRHTELALGTANTLILVTSSFVYSLGLLAAEAGDDRRLFRAALLTVALGLSFLILKGFEWHEDFSKHLFPGAGFGLTGEDVGGARLFFVLYFIATGLHGLHMMAGLTLVAIVALRARHGRYTKARHGGVEVVGLYWCFVDVIWMMLYPLIYLAAR